MNLRSYIEGLGNTLVIRFDNRGIQCEKGRVASSILRDIKNILSELGVEAASIRQSRSGDITFSRKIPNSVHQRLRNILTGGF